MQRFDPTKSPQIRGVVRKGHHSTPQPNSQRQQQQKRPQQENPIKQQGQGRRPREYDEEMESMEYAPPLSPRQGRSEYPDERVTSAFGPEYGDEEHLDPRYAAQVIASSSKQAMPQRQAMMPAAAPLEKKKQGARPDDQFSHMPLPPSRRKKRNVMAIATMIMLILCTVLLFLFTTGLLSR